MNTELLDLVDCNSLGLPKWPGLLVTGENITPAQAEQVILRTEQWYGSNEHAWDNYLKDELTARGFKVDTYGERRYVSPLQNVDKGCVPLGYLYNAQISSSWVGGAHGWCDWSGKIFSNNYNIGKWPSVLEVLNEWKEIARAFPFLDLTAQLLSGEIGEEDIVPVVNFRIKSGEAVAQPSNGLLVSPNTTDIWPELLLRKERGCSKETIDRALNNVFGPKSASL